MSPFLELWSSKWVQLTKKSKDPMHPETDARSAAENSISSDMVWSVRHIQYVTYCASIYPKAQDVFACPSQSELTIERKTPKCTFQSLHFYSMTWSGFNINSLAKNTRYGYIKYYKFKWGLYQNLSFQMAKIERTTNGAATKKTFEDKDTFLNPMWHGPRHILD